MKIWDEFKEFAFKGNVMDMAIGVMIGSAFGGIVNSVVNDLLTPLISVLTGGVDFSHLGVKLSEGEDAAVFAYGNFIQTVINFFIIAICIFIFVKAINKLKKPVEAPAPARKCPFCFGEIAEEATCCPHCTSQLEAVIEKKMK